MARDNLKCGIGASSDNRGAFLAQQSDTRCVRHRTNNRGYVAHRLETSIGAGGFDYDFGAVENTDNEFTKSYTNLRCGSLSLRYKSKYDDRISQL